MKRILALLMGIMMLVSAFAGCSNTANTPSNTDDFVLFLFKGSRHSKRSYEICYILAFFFLA